jgi:O-antigen/teichoic acid export membrane protein
VNNLARRAGWTTADQIASSATNFLLHVLVARSVDPAGFGFFALIFSTYLIALGTVRAVTSKPLNIRFATASRDEHRAAARAATGFSVIVGVATGLLLLAVAAWIDGPMSRPLMVLGAFMPLLMLQDTWRFVFFSGAVPAKAFANDVVWGVGQLTAVVVVVVLQAQPDVGSLVIAWSAGASLAALYGCWQARLLPGIRESASWWNAQRDLGIRLVPEFWLFSGSSQAVYYAIALVAGPAAVGALRAAQTLMAPIKTMLLTVSVLAIPEGARLYKREPAALFRTMSLLSGVLAITGVVWAVGLFLIPDSLGTTLLGKNWQPAMSVMLPMGIFLVLTGSQKGGLAGLHVLGQTSRTLMVSAVTAPAVLILGAAGAYWGNAIGAAWGRAAAAGLTAAALWLHFRAATLRQDNVPQSQTKP